MLYTGGRGWKDERFVEYGLDAEDEEWMQGINCGQNRMPPGRLEQLLWALEVANATATDHALTAAGQSSASQDASHLRSPPMILSPQGFLEPLGKKPQYLCCWVSLRLLSAAATAD